MSDTPETDHLENGLGTAAEMIHPTFWAFARRLERERNELTEALEYILGIGLTEKTKAKAEKALQTND